MNQEFYQPASIGVAQSAYLPFDDEMTMRPSVMPMPINLSPEEIRALVRDVLG